MNISERRLNTGQPESNSDDGAVGLPAPVYVSEGPASAQPNLPDMAGAGFPPVRRPSKSRMTTITVTDHSASSARRYPPSASCSCNVWMHQCQVAQDA